MEDKIKQCEPRRPRIKPIFQVLYLHERIRIGSGQYAIEIDDKENVFTPLIRLLTGENSTDEIVGKMKDLLTHEEVFQSLKLLDESGYLEDASVELNPPLSPSDAERYSVNINFFRTLVDSQSAFEYQARLKSSRVLLFGIGGIGSNVAMALAELGVGHVTVVDFDRITLSNLNRQVLYSTEKVGSLKTESAKARMSEFNPDIDFVVIDKKVNSLQDVQELISKSNPEFVFCLADKPNGYIDFWVNQVCVEQNIPLAAASIGSAIGKAYTVLPKQTACFQCIVDHDLMVNPELREELEYFRKNEINVPNGALGPACMFLAYFLSYEFLRYVLDLGPLLTQGKLFEINFLTFEQQYHSFSQCEECSICGLIKIET